MDAYVYDVVRTPRGRGHPTRGGLAHVRPIELVTHTMNALEERGPARHAVDEIVLGCSTQTGEQGGNLAQIAAVHARWSGVTGATVSRFCCSGLEALRMAASRVSSAPEAGLMLAGGVESMSRVPMFSDRPAWCFDPEVSERTAYVHMGVAADLVATLEGIPREELDQLALASHERSARARRENRFAGVLAPVGADGIAHDEGVREGMGAEDLARLEPAFAALGAEQGDARALAAYPELESVDHRHTVATSPGLADCAALAVVGSRAAGDRAGRTPRARLRAFATYAEEPVKMLTGNVEGTRRALRAAGMRLGDVDLFEVNESFAVVPLLFQRELDLDPERINPNGGALSVGHPLGATGGVLLANALAELERTDQTVALCSVCGGAGVTMTLVLERV